MHTAEDDDLRLSRSRLPAEVQRITEKVSDILISGRW